MTVKKFLREVQVRGASGEVLAGKVYRSLIDASADSGRDTLVDDSLELSDGRTAFRKAGKWVAEDDPSSVFDEIE